MTENRLQNLPPNGYSIRPGDISDAEIIFHMDREQMKPWVDRYYPDEWDDRTALDIVKDNIERLEVIEFSGEIVACYYWWVDEEVAVLHSMQVSRIHRAKGLGTFLLSRFEGSVKNAGIKKVGLAVFEGNPAIHLYLRSGYVITGNDGPNAVTMEKDL